VVKTQDIDIVEVILPLLRRSDVVQTLSLSRLNHGQPGVQAHPEIADSPGLSGKILDR
jgi:hypothetical protein